MALPGDSLTWGWVSCPGGLPGDEYLTRGWPYPGMDLPGDGYLARGGRHPGRVLPGDGPARGRASCPEANVSLGDGNLRMYIYGTSPADFSSRSWNDGPFQK